MKSKPAPALRLFLSCLLGFLTAFFALNFALANPAPAENRAPSATVAGPSDAEIVHAFITTNTVDVDLAKLAQTKATDKDVITFAKELAADHTRLSKQMTDTLKKTPLRPKDNEMSKALTIEAKEAFARLKGLEGKAFDSAYLAHELAFHEKSAANLDNNLLSNVDDDALKNVLMSARPVVGTHIDKIKKLQAELKK